MQLTLVLRVKLFSPIFKQPNQGCKSVSHLVSFPSQWGKIIIPEDDSFSYIEIKELPDIVTEETHITRSQMDNIKWSHILWAYLEWERARYYLPELLFGQELDTISLTNKELSYTIPQSQQKPLLRMFHAGFDVD